MANMGGTTFIIGLVLAAIIALVSSTNAPAWAIFVLGILGLLVGLMNINDKEMQLFMVSAIVFLISFQTLGAVFSTLALGWDSVASFFYLMSVFVAPAAAIVAIKALFAVARD